MGRSGDLRATSHVSVHLRSRAWQPGICPGRVVRRERSDREAVDRPAEADYQAQALSLFANTGSIVFAASIQSTGAIGHGDALRARDRIPEGRTGFDSSVQATKANLDYMRRVLDA